MLVYNQVEKKCDTFTTSGCGSCNKGRAMCYHVRVMMHVKGLQVFATRVGHGVSVTVCSC